MDPLPETRVVLNELVRHGEPELTSVLSGLADVVQRLVPAVVGLSLGRVDSGVVFTLAASSLETAGLRSEGRRGGKECRSRWSPDP